MFAYIENNQLVKIAVELPHTVGRISNFQNLEESRRREYGWFSCEVDKPQINTDFYRYDKPKLMMDSVPNDERIKVVYPVLRLEIRGVRNRLIERVNKLHQQECKHITVNFTSLKGESFIVSCHRDDIVDFEISVATGIKTVTDIDDYRHDLQEKDIAKLLMLMKNKWAELLRAKQILIEDIRNTHEFIDLKQITLAL